MLPMFLVLLMADYSDEALIQFMNGEWLRG